MNFKRDFFESAVDIGSGLFIAIFIQLTIFPLFGLYPSILDSLWISIIFMLVSMVRSALWRRYFRTRR